MTKSRAEALCKACHNNVNGWCADLETNDHKIKTDGCPQLQEIPDAAALILMSCV